MRLLKLNILQVSKIVVLRKNIKIYSNIFFAKTTRIIALLLFASIEAWKCKLHKYLGVFEALSTTKKH